MTEQSKAPAPSSGPSHDAPIGTVHTWTDGKSYVKTANGWIPKPAGGEGQIAGGDQTLGNTPEKNPVFFVDLTGLAKNPEARALAERQIRVVDQVADSMKISFKTPPKVVAGPRMDGAGGAVHAQFTPGADKKPSEIKIFQSKELGASFARETGHAVDHALSQHGVSRIEEVLSGGADVDPKIKDAYENIVKEAQALYGKHLTPSECFARAFEVAVAAGAEKLTAEGRMKQGLHDPSGFSDTFSKPANPEHAKKVSEAERKMKDSYRAAQEAGTGTEEHQKFLDERDAHVAAKKDSASSRALPPEEQKRLKADMLQHVLRVVRHQQFQKSFEDIDTLEKALRPPFYVGVVVVCEGQFLCGKRREDGIWTGPGGGAKHGESPSQAAVRETLEETNLHLKEKDLLELPTLMTNNGRPVHCFLAYMRKQDTASLSEGIHSKNDPDKEVRSWGWYPIDRGFPGNSDPNRHAALLAARVRLRSVRKAEVESFEETLTKAKPLPAGTVRFWKDGRRMVKHPDGEWIFVGGMHHGKIHGGTKAESKQEHQEFADHHAAGDITWVEQPKVEETKESTDETAPVEKKPKNRQTRGATPSKADEKKANEIVTAKEQGVRQTKQWVVANPLGEAAGKFAQMNDVELNAQVEKERHNAESMNNYVVVKESEEHWSVVREGSGITIGYATTEAFAQRLAKDEKNKAVLKDIAGTMPLKDFVAKMAAIGVGGTSLKPNKKVTAIYARDHRKDVESRLEEGYPVPLSVVKEYPELFRSKQGFSEEASRVNLVAYFKETKAPKAVQDEAKSVIQSAAVILDSMGIRFKHPLGFAIASNASKDKIGLQASYGYVQGRPESRTVTLAAISRVSTTILHELGHAVDHAMAPERNAADRSDRTEGYRSGQARQGEKGHEALDLHRQVQDIVRETLLYKNNKTGAYGAYLRDPTEVFARAFEVWAKEKATLLEKEGKIEKGFADSMIPAIFRSSAISQEGINNQQEKLRKIQDNYATEAEGAAKILEGNPTDEGALRTIKIAQEQAAKIDVQMMKLEVQRGILPEADQKALTDAIFPLMERILKEDQIRKSLLALEEALTKSDVSGAISADSTHAAEETKAEASLSDFQSIFLDRLRQDVGVGPLNQPVEIPLKDLNCLTVWKVDDGIYSGNVKGPNGDILVQAERLTGVGLAGILLSKELLMTEQEWNRMMLDAEPVEEFVEAEEAPAPPSEKLRALEILAEALENFKGDLHIHL